MLFTLRQLQNNHSSQHLARGIVVIENILYQMPRSPLLYLLYTAYMVEAVAIAEDEVSDACRFLLLFSRLCDTFRLPVQVPYSLGPYHL